METKAVCPRCKITYIIHDCDRLLCTMKCRCGGILVYYRSRVHWQYKHVSVNQVELISPGCGRAAKKLIRRR